MQNLVLCYPVIEKHLKAIQEAWPEVRLICADQNNKEDSEQKLFQADYFCGHVKKMVDWKSIVAQKRLKWIQSSAAGMDHCLVPEVIDSEIVVCSASGLLADQVAEHAMSLILGWLRSLSIFMKAQEKREFVRRPTGELIGSTVGIVGFGGNGRRIAQVLAPFGVKILATDLFPEDKPDEVEKLWPESKLDILLTVSDIVILNLPLNAKTRKLFGRNLFSLMKKEALFVNMARGGIVDTDALIEALRQKTIAGAVMDVVDPEPLPESHPLWECENVIITPHVAGQLRWRNDDVTSLLCENIRRYRNGEPLINHLTDKNLGFPIRSPETPLWIDLKNKYQVREKN